MFKMDMLDAVAMLSEALEKKKRGKMLGIYNEGSWSFDRWRKVHATWKINLRLPTAIALAGTRRINLAWGLATGSHGVLWQL
jgi:hypothetical protein